MKIHLQRKNEAVHFEGSSELTNVKVNIDGSESIGGEGKGVRPMELVLMALGSCSVFDLSSILQKQRQIIADIQVEVEGKRREEIPNIFTHIHITFTLRDNSTKQKCIKRQNWPSRNIVPFTTC